MGLDDAERRALAELERQLDSEDPTLAPRLAGEGGGSWRLQPAPVATATLVFLAAVGWLAVRAGDVIPVILALPAAGAVAALLRWQHTDRRPSDPPPDERPGSSSDTPPSASPPR